MTTIARVYLGPDGFAYALGFEGFAAWSVGPVEIAACSRGSGEASRESLVERVHADPSVRRYTLAPHEAWACAVSGAPASHGSTYELIVLGFEGFEEWSTGPLSIVRADPAAIEPAAIDADGRVEPVALVRVGETRTVTPNLLLDWREWPVG